MRQIVLDPSAFLAWFPADGPGRSVRAEYEEGALQVHVPRAFSLQVLEAVHREHDMDGTALERLAAEIGHLGFEEHDPPPAETIRWLAAGCDADRAPYAALASSRELPLLSMDGELLRLAASVARDPRQW